MEELEESLSLPEIRAILDASREREHRQNRFLASLQGIDLDDGADSAKEKFEEVQRRANAKLTGRSETEQEFDVFGLEIETEE